MDNEDLEDKELFKLPAAAEMHPCSCQYQEEMNLNSEPYPYCTCTCTPEEVEKCKMEV